MCIRDRFRLAQSYRATLADASDDSTNRIAVGLNPVSYPHLVDTHVYRVSHRMGLVPKTADTPRKVEDYLMKHIPACLLYTSGRCSASAVQPG